MQPGDRVAGRFELDRLGGTGGMGAVWRARDLETGELCALKVVLNHDAAQVARFQREAWTLAQLDHPGITRHVAHGVTEDGRPYLAMEWLDGEDLAARLRRGPLGADQALDFARRVAEALEAVHAAGVVHRDLKPGNLFLPGGDLERVKLLDFGISRHADATYGLTDPGAPLGTPAYMAPEQVRGDVEIDARADVYALGCVLFECLAGRPPYVAAHPLAVLAKILFEEAPRPSELSPDVPAALDPLVARLIAKDAARRPADGRALAAELRAFRGRDWRSAPEAPPPAQALTEHERRLVSVILAAEVRDGERGPASIRLHPGLLTPRPRRDAHTLDAPPTVPTAYLPLLASLREAADHYGARLEVLRDGSVAAVLSGAPSPLDLAASGARCALAIRALLPNAWVALATSWGVVESGQPIGQVIDRAGALLDARAATAPPAPRPVLLDSMTAALLGPRFELRSDPRGGSPHPGLRADEPRYAPGPVLLAEREAAEVARALLGRPTPCLGRDRELRALEDLFDDCAGEPRAHAAVITGPAGVGKSRLRAELTRRLLARSQRLEIWLGRGDPLRAGAPLGLLAQMICRAAQIQGGEPLEDRRSKLAARVARSVEPHAAPRVAEFLGEVIGTPFPDEGSVELAAARKDALLLGDQMRRAFLDLLAGACREQPVLLILEDLHWGDAPSVEYVDAALRLLCDQPLLVLALGRPELRDVFPALWAEREATEMRLGELPRRACERLVRAALGGDLPDDRVAMIVERASGNAFFLEELVRAEADGRGEADAPATVLAMLQGRLDAQGPDARRVLRAGSVLGDVFWRGAVAHLTGEVRRPGSIDAVLAELERRELITRRPDARFHGEVEYRFRHSLVREAAYGMLTDEDRALGHRLAAAWLEAMGERDAMVLAEHLEKGGEEARAVEQYRRAAEQALGANDLSAARARANRAITRGATGALLGELHLVRAETLRWCGELLDAEESALQALSAFPSGTSRWCDAATELCGAASRLGHRDPVIEVARALEACWDERGGAPQVVAMASIAATLLHLGERELAAGPAARAETAAAALVAGDITSDPAVPSGRPAAPPDPSARLAVLRMRGVQAMLDGDVAAAHRRFAELADAQEAAGNLRRACQYRVSAAMMLIELGDHAEAIRVLRAAQAQAERLGITSLEAMAKGHLGLALALAGDAAAARIRTEEAVVYFFVRGDRRLEAGYRTNLARILRVTGDLHGAVIEARRAEGALAVVPPLRPYALAVLAEALLLSGDRAEALARAAEAVALMDRVRLVEQGEALARLIHAEALDAAGERAAARAALTEARARLLQRASWIPDARLRATFLEAVPENARTLALAAAWLTGEGEAGRAVGA